MSDEKPIDVWDAATFDTELLDCLAEQADVIRDYVNRKNEIFLTFDHHGSDEAFIVRPKNEFSTAFNICLDMVSTFMKVREIRAWHYTRLTSREAEDIESNGVKISTPEMLYDRLNNLVTSGLLDSERAEALLRQSPFQSEQATVRTGKFYVRSHPLATSDPGVSRLLRYWGGEVASFHLDDHELLETLTQIGRACVIEVTIPLRFGTHNFSAAKAVVATKAIEFGCVEESNAFDLYVGHLEEW